MKGLLGMTRQYCQFRDQILIVKLAFLDDDLNALFGGKAGDVQKIRANGVPCPLREGLPPRIDSLVIFLGRVVPSQIAKNTSRVW
jgi:hypothetical protein